MAIFQFRSAIKYQLLSAFSIVAVLTLPQTFAAPVQMPPAMPYVSGQENEEIPASPTANSEYTPLMLAKDAKERGISLSGNAKLCNTGKQQFKLESGCILLHTEEPVFIKTCRADISILKGATIVVSATKEVTRILNLSDRKRNSIRVIFGKRYVPLNPGEEINVVCSKAPDADKASVEFVIRFRNAQTISITPDMKAVFLEFSLSDALRHCLIFKQLRESSDPADKVLLDEIVKTAAAVNTMFVGRGPYTHGPNDTAIASKTKQRQTVASRHRLRRLAILPDADN